MLCWCVAFVVGCYFGSNLTLTLSLTVPKLPWSGLGKKVSFLNSSGLCCCCSFFFWYSSEIKSQWRSLPRRICWATFGEVFSRHLNCWRLQTMEQWTRWEKIKDVIKWFFTRKMKCLQNFFIVLVFTSTFSLSFTTFKLLQCICSIVKIAFSRCELCESMLSCCAWKIH